MNFSFLHSPEQRCCRANAGNKTICLVEKRLTFYGGWCISRWLHSLLLERQKEFLTLNLLEAMVKIFSFNGCSSEFCLLQWSIGTDNKFVFQCFLLAASSQSHFVWKVKATRLKSLAFRFQFTLTSSLCWLSIQCHGQHWELEHAYEKWEAFPNFKIKLQI